MVICVVVLADPIALQECLLEWDFSDGRSVRG